jgi:hypothetical protein
VEFQQRGSGRPPDDVIVKATNGDGSAAILEIQAKRTLTFMASDKEFAEVVGQMREAAQKPEFQTSRYELAVAIARTTTRVEHACQEVLHWARQLPDGATFAAHIAITEPDRFRLQFPPRLPLGRRRVRSSATGRRDFGQSLVPDGHC